MAEETRTRLSLAEFEMLPESRHPLQLIAGELLEVPPPTPRHQTLVVRLVIALSRLRPDGRVLVAPVAVYLDERNVVEPDVMWLSPESRCAVTPRRLEGAPDLIVEILSASTARYDKTVKFLLYEKYGAREYWLVDPVRRLVEVWTLDGVEFVLIGTFGAEDSFASPALAATVALTPLLAD